MLEDTTANVGNEHNNQENTIGASKAFPRTKQSIAFALSDLYLCRISTTTTDTIFNLALIHACNLSPPLSPRPYPLFLCLRSRLEGWRLARFGYMVQVRT